MKRIMNLSLDLDNKWSYLKIHGGTSWESYPTYLPVFVPYVLDLLDELRLKITFFIVGKDAEQVENQEYIQEIARRGHEIGNHSLHHESWLHLYHTEQLKQEVLRTQDAIRKVIDTEIKGFRGPGFSWCNELLNILSAADYVYDASVLPTWIGPLARKYYFWTSGLSKEERKVRKGLFGAFKDGFRPDNPFVWETASEELLEIPVTTMPCFRIPFHLSYLVYLDSFSPLLRKIYMNHALFQVKVSGVKPSFLLHPLDLIGGDQLSDLKFFPGMKVDSETKKTIFREVIQKLKKNFSVMRMIDFAERIKNENRLRKKIPDK